MYEAICLANVAENLAAHEGLRLRLIAGRQLAFKTSPGPINRSYPYIEVTNSGRHVADLFLDTEFVGISCLISGKGGPTCYGDYHELDIMVVDRGITSRPTPDQVWLGVECKHTPFKKEFLRGVLGLRRELSLLVDSNRTRFTQWPRRSIPADPGACLLFVTSDPKVHQYSDPGDAFGIDFVHLPI